MRKRVNGWPISSLRGCAIVVAALIVAACHRANYLYAELHGTNIEVAKSGKPPLGYWRFGGDPIPILYALKDPSVSMSLAVGNEAFVPNLEIVSSIPIRSVSVGASGWAIPKTRFEYKVAWNVQGSDPLSHVGNALRISVELEDRSDPIVISGVIATSGRFYYGGE